MKKLLVIVCALIVVAACAAPPPANQNTATTNANTAASPAIPPMTEADAIAKEKAIWETIKVKDYDAFAAMLATDQIEVLPEGVLDKAGTVENIKLFEPTETNFGNWKYLSIDKDAFVVIYDVTVKGKYAGKDFPAETAHASSAWVNRDGKWLAIYHQECAAKPATPPAATKTPAATPATSPVAAEPPPVMTSDPAANEKLVWELFKSKRYDAFATLLAADFVEVEPTGVIDRAGSLKGVQMFDASKAVLSDFKTVTLDDDAALVTYTVNNPVPMFAKEGERHTTIWVKRDKWMGLFHHGGTPVRPPMPKPSASVAKPSPAASPSATRTP